MQNFYLFINGYMFILTHYRFVMFNYIIILHFFPYTINWQWNHFFKFFNTKKFEPLIEELRPLYTLSRKRLITVLAKHNKNCTRSIT